MSKISAQSPSSGNSPPKGGTTNGPTNNSGLKVYRAAIRAAWLPVVGRKKLKSFERKLIEKWFANGEDINLVLRAIKQCAARARDRGVPLWSLGIVSGDLEALKREHARLSVGSQTSMMHSTITESHRDRLRERIDSMAEASTNPERRAMLGELRDQLPALDVYEALRRLHEIQR